VVVLMFAGNKFHATDKQHWMPFSKNAIKKEYLQKILLQNNNAVKSKSLFS